MGTTILLLSSLHQTMVAVYVIALRSHYSARKAQATPTARNTQYSISHLAHGYSQIPNLSNSRLAVIDIEREFVTVPQCSRTVVRRISDVGTRLMR
ncbi:hypothetical protein A0H81_06605 [Grifola frondosa]|uniref:Secreted protein n=1 Tax=Grifola frondosa TaxID=5627 RepID=A0A1C7M925_GRIFR|nr:hypothetical protein A0H81_06605 [Grifola frondosa]